MAILTEYVRCSCHFDHPVFLRDVTFGIPAACGHHSLKSSPSIEVEVDCPHSVVRCVVMDQSIGVF